MASVFKLLGILVFSVVFVGCGAGFKAGDPWDPNEEPFFDDGIDVVEDLSSISGSWAYEYKKNLDARLQLADLIAEVEILSVQTISDVDGETARRLDVKVKKLLYGKAPDKEQIALFSAKEARGYELILRYERRLTGNFLLFVRWFNDEDKKVANHFHLSPASPDMKSQVEAKVDMRKKEEAAIDRR